jgi:hypothetical protein
VPLRAPAIERLLGAVLTAIDSVAWWAGPIGYDPRVRPSVQLRSAPGIAILTLVTREDCWPRTTPDTLCGITRPTADR